MMGVVCMHDGYVRWMRMVAFDVMGGCRVGYRLGWLYGMSGWEERKFVMEKGTAAHLES